MSTPADAEQLRCWLALAQTPGVGPQGFRELLAHFPDLTQLFQEKPQSLEALGLQRKTLSALRNPDWQRVENSLKWQQESPFNTILTLYDPRYPALLKEIPSPPPVLFVQGQVDTLARPQLAMVGSRNPTASGLGSAFDFAKALGQLGLAITSGLALGIDGAAHQGALAGKGITIGIAGTGPDRIYPAKHKKLAENIVTSGAIMSEFPPGTPVRAQHFPRRNRIIAGLSLGTLVVEAAMNSGSLITARYALEHGREVLAIPGSIHNPLARGCNALIREGAKLVESIEDVLEALNLLTPTSPPQPTLEAEPSPFELTKDYQDLLNKINFAPTPVDRLVELTGMAPEAIASMVLVLELEGYVIATAGGSYQRIR